MSGEKLKNNFKIKNSEEDVNPYFSQNDYTGKELIRRSKSNIVQKDQNLTIQNIDNREKREIMKKNSLMQTDRIQFNNNRENEKEILLHQLIGYAKSIINRELDLNEIENIINLIKENLELKVPIKNTNQNENNAMKRKKVKKFDIEGNNSQFHGKLPILKKKLKMNRINENCQYYFI